MRNGDRLRVLLVSPCFGAYGGVEAFVFAVADAVGRDPRFDVRVCFKRVANFSLQPALEKYCQAAHVEFCDRASRQLWSAIGWADVVHAQNASPDVAMMTTLLRKPLALTIHDFLPAAPWLRRLSWQASARAASARWYNSRSVWRTWEPDGDRAASARVPTVSRFELSPAAPTARKGFLFVGRLVDSKGVEVLLDAYQRAGLDPAVWPLTIVGDGPLRAALEARAAAAGLSAVRFLGFVDEAMKARLLASSKWLVAPSHAHEGLGLVVLEARHAGVPCIIARHGGLPEAGGRDALVCEPRDVTGLAALLTRAATMAECEYGERSRRTKAELANELVPLSFYSDAYVGLSRQKLAEAHG
jgi:glycosyltransferase involved in cell wall biosynthesis